MIDEEADIVRVATLARVSSESKVKDRARMEAKVEEADTEIRVGAEAEKALSQTMIIHISCSGRVTSSTCD